MFRWFQAMVVAERSRILGGDISRVERRYLPGALATGIVVGSLVGHFFMLPVLLVFIAFGFALGFGVRSYISYRRREKFRRERHGW